MKKATKILLSKFDTEFLTGRLLLIHKPYEQMAQKVISQVEQCKERDIILNSLIEIRNLHVKGVKKHGKGIMK